MRTPELEQCCWEEDASLRTESAEYFFITEDDAGGSARAFRAPVVPDPYGGGTLSLSEAVELRPDAQEEMIVELSCCDSVSALQEEFLGKGIPVEVVNELAEVQDAPDLLPASLLRLI